VRRGRVQGRITLLLLGSNSPFQSDRTPGGSPIEKIYETYGKAEIVVAHFLLRPVAQDLLVLPRSILRLR
jgi:hypothetical protein